MSDTQPPDSHEPGGPDAQMPRYDSPTYGAPTYGAPQPPQQPYHPGAMTPSDENTWSALGHFGGLVLGLLAPLIVLLVKGKDSARVRAQSVEALNFQISMTIYAIVSIPLMIVLVGFITLLAVSVMVIVFSILAGIKALNGEEYRYPLTIRLVK